MDSPSTDAPARKEPPPAAPDLASQRAASTTDGARGRVLHEPTPEQLSAARLTHFADWLGGRVGLQLRDYPTLHAWSVSNLESFWAAVWDFFDLGQRPASSAVLRGDLIDAEWFAGCELNYAALALRAEATRVAVVSIDEAGERRELNYAALARRVGAYRRELESAGLQPGDRVAGYLPNTVEALVAFLAVASVGAVWSSCPPEFGIQGVLDRFSSIEPRILIAVPGYRYGGRWFDREAQVRAIRAALPSVTHLVWVTEPQSRLEPAELGFWDLADAPLTAPRPVPFSHPLFILYSSGTTGKPKPIVHGHGGIALEHLKALALHSDLGPGDRFFWFSTTGWMMWNYLISGLLVGATIVLYDGSPASPDLSVLWRLASREKVTYFGASAPFLMSCRAAGLALSPLELRCLRAVGSTGSALPPEGFEWLYAQLPNTVRLDSISGGTDVCTAFLIGCPWLPVRSGELTCAALGAAVVSVDQDGRELLGEVGELVVKRPMPSMPLRFWNDPDGSRRREAYFERFAGAWHHGDWICHFADGAFVVYGRSDATLNRGGVRMGTSEFYRAIEGEVTDALVVEVGGFGESGKLLLFVVPRPHAVLEAEPARLSALIRGRLSPRHVPDSVVLVTDIPYTASGKKVEVPVKRVLSGAQRAASVNLGTLRNPDAFTHLIAAGRRALDAARPTEKSTG